MAFSAIQIKAMLETVKGNAEYLGYNAKLHSILKGQLLQFVLCELRKQLTGQSAKIAEQRVAPINVLQRIVSKLARLYTSGVVRTPEEPSDAVNKALAWYTKQMDPDTFFGLANRYFNLTKSCLIQPFWSDALNKPQMRVIPSHQFVAYSDNDEGVPTGYILLMGRTSVGTKMVQYFYAEEKDRFCYFTEEGDDITSAMDPENPDGVNDLGAISLVYINQDLESIMPVQDTDIYQMATLIPVLLTDCNFAQMFSVFSVMYGIDVDDQGIRYAPNAFWTFKSKAGGETKPQVGVLKPQADINQSLAMIANELALWLQSKDITPGAFGEINGTNFSSGIAKIIDNMDTSDNRKEQVPYFKKAEEQFWDLVLNKLHPAWKAQGKPVENITLPDAICIQTEYPEQVPLVRRGAMVKELKEEVDAGFLKRVDAIQMLNRSWTKEQAEAYMKEIDEEKTEPKDDKETPPAVPPVEPDDDDKEEEV